MIVGDKVICIDNEGAEDVLIKDAIYTVSAVFSDGVIGITNMKCFAYRFKKISNEERMCGYMGFKENKIKTIRKIEELAGLENGKGMSLGLHIHVCEDGCTDFINILANNKCFYSVPFSDVDDEFFKTLKAMGFEFEWKPKRTLEEVLNDYEEIDFVVEQDNCAVYEDARNGGFSVGVYRGYKTAGTKYYLRKDAEKICKELNS